MFNFFIGMIVGTSFGFLLGAMMTHAKFADERMEREKEDLADWRMKQAEIEMLQSSEDRKRHA